MEQVRARMDAQRGLLGGLQGQPEWQAVSWVQAQALVAVASRVVPLLTPEDRADLVAEVASIPFHGDHKQQVLSSFEGQSKVAPSGALRRCMQDYRSFLEFCTEAEWQVLLDASINEATKRSVLVQRLLALGCRCPSEKTIKLAASLIDFLCQLGKAWTPAATPVESKRGMAAFKDCFKSASGKLPAPAVYMDVLPASPSALAPAMRTAAYKDGGPIPCPVEGGGAARVHEFDAMSKCRARPGHVHTMPHADRCAAGFAGAGDTTALESFGKMFMSGMHVMQQQQMQFLSSMVAGRTKDHDVVPMTFSSGTKKPRVASEGLMITTPGIAQSEASGPCVRNGQADVLAITDKASGDGSPEEKPSGEEAARMDAWLTTQVSNFSM